MGLVEVVNGVCDEPEGGGGRGEVLGLSFWGVDGFKDSWRGCRYVERFEHGSYGFGIVFFILRRCCFLDLVTELGLVLVRYWREAAMSCPPFVNEVEE